MKARFHYTLSQQRKKLIYDSKYRSVSWELKESWLNLDNNHLLYTDPYTSRSPMLGFSGTLGGAWTFGAAVTAATAKTENKQTCFQVAPFTSCWIKVLHMQKETRFYLVVFLVEALPSLLAKGACLLQLCRDLWMVLPWRPFLPACSVGPLWWYHKFKTQNMSNHSDDRKFGCSMSSLNNPPKPELQNFLSLKIKVKRLTKNKCTDTSNISVDAVKFLLIDLMWWDWLSFVRHKST